MEISTPPNTSGFSRKPKNRKRVNERKSTPRKSGINELAGMSDEAKAWMLGSLLLIAVAKILGPVIRFDVPPIRKTDIATD